MCESYCTHGGVCELEPGHSGSHDSRYCQWTDDQAVTRAEADAALSTKPGGAEVVDLINFMERVLGDDR